MRRRVPIAAGLGALIVLLGLRASFGWGENAERLVTNKAVDTLPDEMRPFFEANRQFIVQHVVDPEESANKNPAEANNGFIQLDHYGAFPFTKLPRSYSQAVAKLTKRTIDTYGLLPWQIGVVSKRLTDAFREKNWADVKEQSAILAHYVAAAHDPFNTTTNNDGRLSNQLGVNQRFATGLVDRYQLFFFVRANDAVLIHDPTDHAFEMALSAHSWLENVLLCDLRAHATAGNYGDAYYDQFYSQAGAVLVRQLSDASTDIGSYWMSAWINAGRPPLPPQ